MGRLAGIWRKRGLDNFAARNGATCVARTLLSAALDFDLFGGSDTPVRETAR